MGVFALKGIIYSMKTIQGTIANSTTDLAWGSRSLWKGLSLMRRWWVRVVLSRLVLVAQIGQPCGVQIGLPCGVRIGVTSAFVVLLVGEREVASLVLVEAFVVLWRATAKRSRWCEVITLSWGEISRRKSRRHIGSALGELGWYVIMYYESKDGLV